MRKYVFLGMAGSGKSEVAIHFALKLSRDKENPVHFFDMDQTKSVFRSRELKQFLEKNHIIVHSGEQLLDAPVVPHAVREILEDESNVIVFDVGGNAAGAITMGQYSGYINQDDTAVYFMINCYRPFVKGENDLKISIEEIKLSAGVSKLQLISNPNYGMYTSLDEVINGSKIIQGLSEKVNIPIAFLCVPDWLYDEVSQKAEAKILKITPYIKL
ncbi:nucleoside/nucleotide kinase family protein [Lutispora saccharofermentans]|uniref:CobQ/CobB/MinD/ParA nucleotide binding domain-containing protein n=1 Tax=Lutispora saccharofermentans TaxID=3024236 RepID=A0ABT1NIQ6_9FIRM|nr:hypothetical protein [Lutispora saccharofermentans]MCQ1531165.1 hypothetical protein [Lutispora saccharofermentans]